jgi:hypothetical protein
MLWVWLLAYLHGHLTAACGLLPRRFECFLLASDSYEYYAHYLLAVVAHLLIHRSISDSRHTQMAGDSLIGAGNSLFATLAHIVLRASVVNLETSLIRIS